VADFAQDRLKMEIAVVATTGWQLAESQQHYSPETFLYDAQNLERTSFPLSSAMVEVWRTSTIS